MRELTLVNPPRFTTEPLKLYEERFGIGNFI